MQYSLDIGKMSLNNAQKSSKSITAATNTTGAATAKCKVVSGLN
jgi:hypothetical protein